jgi:hypothetical protein
MFNKFTILNNASSSSSSSSSSPGLKLKIIGNSELYRCIPFSLHHSNLNNRNESNEISNDDVTMHEVGRWGESLVYQYLISQQNASDRSTIEWLNKDNETKAPYDILVTNDTDNGYSRRNYIEVKSTRYRENNVFEISLQEWEFATGQPRVNYSVYRVLNALDATKVNIVIIPDLLEAIKNRDVKLCIAI